MQTAIVIDDEARGRLALKEKIHHFCPQVTVVGEAENGQEGIRMIEKYQPSIVFLDIEMPGMNGFEVLNNLPQRNFHIIFTTAYDHYAIKAIKYAAFDYLLKPVDINELKQTIQKLEQSTASDTQRRASVLQENISSLGKTFSKLAVPSLEGLCFYKIEDIIYLEANSNYTIFHIRNAPKVVASKTLKDFEDLLPEDIFFRPHHSFLVNLNYIKRYIKGDGGQIELENGDLVDLSRRKKDQFLKLLGIY